ncbi:unnamed protein product [Amoebophrya sp. A120]|nr:unnamed protein product [Amoebophrya sp. A120]|eukprot:GSA120T00003721001.1
MNLKKKAVGFVIETNSSGGRGKTTPAAKRKNKKEKTSVKGACSAEQRGETVPGTVVDSVSGWSPTTKALDTHVDDPSGRPRSDNTNYHADDEDYQNQQTEQDDTDEGAAATSDCSESTEDAEDGVDEDEETSDKVELEDSESEFSSFLDKNYIEVELDEQLLHTLLKLEQAYSTKLLSVRTLSARRLSSSATTSGSTTAATNLPVVVPLSRKMDDIKANPAAFVTDIASANRNGFSSFSVRKLLKPLPLSGGDIDLMLVKFKQGADYAGGAPSNVSKVIPACLEMGDLVLLLDLVRQRSKGAFASVEDVLDRVLM